MFVGRERELAALEKLYASRSFEMVVVYGRRRVGKTALLEEFSKGKRTLAFTAQLQSDKDNLSDFSRVVFQCFGLPDVMPSFADWASALQFVAKQAKDTRLVVVIDEFPYACGANSALPSTLQVAIDKHLRHSSVMLVLCGSNQGFMEGEVLGEKSPLYGRRSAQLKLRPFDYLDAARMMPDCPVEEKVSYYASLGGTPYYLGGIDLDEGYVANMSHLFFSPTGMMFEEPNMLMMQELREPAVFSSVMRAIAHGANKQGEIASAVGISAGSLGFYLKTLISLGLVERVVPFGESGRSKRALYRISDPAFSFWYRFAAPYASAIEQGLGASVAERLLTGDRRAEYEGHVFERVCAEWIVRQARESQLPLSVTGVGSWWGGDPVTRKQTDIDVVAEDKIDRRLLIAECKWRNDIDETAVVASLRDKRRLLPGYRSCECYLFTKHPVSQATREREKADTTLHFVSAQDLFS